jgi:hypothetical protein
VKIPYPPPTRLVLEVVGAVRNIHDQRCIFGDGGLYQARGGSYSGTAILVGEGVTNDKQPRAMAGPALGCSLRIELLLPGTQLPDSVGARQLGAVAQLDGDVLQKPSQ